MMHIAMVRRHVTPWNTLGFWKIDEIFTKFSICWSSRCHLVVPTDGQQWPHPNTISLCPLLCGDEKLLICQVTALQTSKLLEKEESHCPKCEGRTLQGKCCIVQCEISSRLLAGDLHLVMLFPLLLCILHEMLNCASSSTRHFYLFFILHRCSKLWVQLWFRY